MKIQQQILTVDKTAADNSTYKKLAVQCLNEALYFVSSSVVADSFRLRNHLLRQAPAVSGHAVTAKITKRHLKLMATLFLSIAFILTSCSDSGSQTKTSDRLFEDPEHHIKDSPDITKHDSTILYTGWYYIVDTDNGFKRQLDKSTDTFFIDPKPIVTAKNFATFEIYESNAGGEKYIGMTMRLDETGTENWSVATEKAIGKQLAFILDNRLLQVAKVNSQIKEGATALNRGDYSRAELENFKAIIESEK